MCPLRPWLVKFRSALVGGLLCALFFLSACTHKSSSVGPVGAAVDPDGFAGGGVESYLASVHATVKSALDLYGAGYDLDSLGKGDCGSSLEVCGIWNRLQADPDLMSDVLDLLGRRWQGIRDRMVHAASSPPSVYQLVGLPFADGQIGSIARTPRAGAGIGPTRYYGPEMMVWAQNRDTASGIVVAAHEAIHTLESAFDNDETGHFTASKGFAGSGVFWRNQGLGAILAVYAANHLSYASAVLAERPIGFWRFGEAAQALQAKDSSGNNHSGNYRSGVSLGAKGALSVDSNTSAAFDNTLPFVGLTRPAGGALLPLGNAAPLPELTVELIFAPSASPVDPYNGIAILASASDQALVLTDDGKIGFTSGQGDLWGTDFPVSAGQWTHVVARFTSHPQQNELYLNGVKQTLSQKIGTTPSQVTAAGLADFALGIGGPTDGNLGLFAGQIDEVAIYGSPLSIEQITAHAGLAGLSATSSHPTPAPSSSRNVCTESQSWDVVRALYLDLRGRPATFSELQAWLPSTPAQRASLITVLLASDDWKTLRMRAVYRVALHRAMNPVEVTNWLSYLAAGHTWEDFLVEVIGSNEFVLDVFGPGSGFATSTASDADYDRLFNAVYLTLLGRPLISAGDANLEEPYWAGQYASFRSSPLALSAAIKSIVVSIEAREIRLVRFASNDLQIAVPTLAVLRDLVSQFADGTATEEATMQSLALGSAFQDSAVNQVKRFYGCALATSP